MAGYCGPYAGTSHQPNDRANGDLGAASEAAQVECIVRTGASRRGGGDSRARSRSDGTKDERVAEPVALVERGHAEQCGVENDWAAC